MPEASRDRSLGTLAKKYETRTLPSREYRNRTDDCSLEHSADFATYSNEFVLRSSVSRVLQVGCSVVFDKRIWRKGSSLFSFSNSDLRDLGTD